MARSVVTKKRQVSIEDGRLVRPGSSKAAPTTWNNGRRRYDIKDMKGSHILSVIKKLQEGATSRRSVFVAGKEHPAYQILIDEAARRGLCLNEDAAVSNINIAAQALRTKTLRLLPLTDVTRRQSALGAESKEEKRARKQKEKSVQHAARQNTGRAQPRGSSLGGTRSVLGSALEDDF